MSFEVSKKTIQLTTSCHDDFSCLSSNNPICSIDKVMIGYNEERPHNSLADLTSAEYMEQYAENSNLELSTK
jgi:hypothetical protein